MKTIYDWVCLGIFAGLVVLFLQRSTSDQEQSHDDPLVVYLVAGAGCGLANYLGNGGQDIFAILLLAATLALILRYLKPFQPRSKP